MNIADLQQVAENKSEVVAASSDSISPVKNLLSDVFCRLELKSKKFQVLSSATPSETDDIWRVVLSIGDTLRSACDTYTKKTIAQSSQFKYFLDHCCRVCHYSFGIRKCGSPTCTVCKSWHLCTTYT